MAGKTITTATLFSQKKLLGRSHTSNIKSDAQEGYPSNIQAAAQTIFGENIPDNPSRTLYLLQSASAGLGATVEYVDFDVTAIAGTSYDANTGSFGQVGFGGGDEDTVVGPHGYQLSLTGSYQSLSSNPKKGNGVFNNSKAVYETLGKLQLIPPNFSNQGSNPYYLKLYKGDPSNPANEITSLDESDWQVDYYSGIIFVQDYKADRIPKYARAFVYVGKFSDEINVSVSGAISQVYTSGNITGSGLLGNEIRLKDDITLTSVTASFSGVLYGTASFANTASYAQNTSFDATKIQNAYNRLRYQKVDYFDTTGSAIIQLPTSSFGSSAFPTGSMDYFNISAFIKEDGRWINDILSVQVYTASNHVYVELSAPALTNTDQYKLIAVNENPADYQII